MREEFPKCPASDPFPHTFTGARNGSVPSFDAVTADEATLDYLQSKSERSKLCYPFDPLEMTPLRAKGKYWLIKGIIARGETSAWIAPPGAMKSALMAHLAMCVANFKDWNGLKHKNHGAVLYFALERQDLVKRRLWAHHATMAMQDRCDVAVVTGMIDLSTIEGVNRIVATVDAAREAMGSSIGLLIFDTFAKLVSAAGLDENKASDQGRIFANLQRLKDQLNRGVIGAPHIAIVGHTGKDESRGARGSNAFYGDVDVMVEITSSGDVRTASVTKANDMPEGALFSFGSEVHTFGTDEDGDPITVNIVSSDPISAQVARPQGAKLTGQNQKLLFRILHDAGAAGLTLEDWNNLARDAGITRKATLTEARYALEDKKMVRQSGGRWHVDHAA